MTLSNQMRAALDALRADPKHRCETVGTGGASIRLRDPETGHVIRRGGSVHVAQRTLKALEGRGLLYCTVIKDGHYRSCPGRTICDCKTWYHVRRRWTLRRGK